MWLVLTWPIGHGVRKVLLPPSIVLHLLSQLSCMQLNAYNCAYNWTLSKLHPARLCALYCDNRPRCPQVACYEIYNPSNPIIFPRWDWVYLCKRVHTALHNYATLDCHAFYKRDQEIRHGTSVPLPYQPACFSCSRVLLLFFILLKKKNSQ